MKKVYSITTTSAHLAWVTRNWDNGINLFEGLKQMEDQAQEEGTTIVSATWEILKDAPLSPLEELISQWGTKDALIEALVRCTGVSEVATMGDDAIVALHKHRWPMS